MKSKAIRKITKDLLAGQDGLRQAHALAVISVQLTGQGQAKLHLNVTGNMTKELFLQMLRDAIEIVETEHAKTSVGVGGGAAVGSVVQAPVPDAAQDERAGEP